MATVDLGKISFVNKGTYDASTTYEERDVVQFTDGALSSYVYINATPASGQTPSTGGSVNSSHWSIFAGGVSLAVGNNKIVTSDASGTITGLSGNNKIITTNASGVPTALSMGSAGQALKVNSSANGFEFGVSGGVKEIFYQNFDIGNIAVSSNFFSYSFTPTQSGNAIVAYTINYRMNSATYMYGRLDFNNGSGNDGAIRVDGFNHASSASPHNQSGAAIVRVPGAITAGNACTVKVINEGGDTANQSGDGDYEASVTIWIV